MPKAMLRYLCFTAGVYLVMYFGDKAYTVITESESMKREKKETRNARSKDISLHAKMPFPAVDDHGFGSTPIALHKDQYRHRRLLSNEDEPAKQTNKSFMIKDASFAQKHSFPDDIQELCPFADICQQKSLEAITRPYISCCRSCYCDDNCGRRGDCCFTADGAYNPETDNTTECIETAIPGLDGPILPMIKEYRVIDSCLSSEQTCKEKTSAPWGALFPGYSPKTKHIYYNMHCAACNSVDDFQPWKFYIMSESVDVSNELLLEALDGNRDPIVFIPPNTDDVMHHECFKSAIKACNVTGLWQEYDPAIEEACHKFQAPVYHRRANVMFKNIYCLICNGKADDYFERCLPHPLYSRGGLEAALSGILDFTRISQTLSPVRSVSSGKDCPKHTVHHPYKAECRPILCPFGYTMTSSGCQLYIREWNKYGYTVRIELLPEQEGLLIPEADFETLSENERKNPKLWINTQGLPVDTFELFGQVRQNTSSVSKLVVRVGRNQSPVKIDKVLQKIEKALSKIWLMKLNGYTYNLKAKLYRFHTYFESNDFKEFDVGSRIGNHLNNGYMFISKMNFCKQVQLYNGEFVFLRGTSRGIQLNLTGDGSEEKILGDGEFYGPFGKSIASPWKICIDDYIRSTPSAGFNPIQGRLFTTISSTGIAVIGWYLTW